MAGSAQGPAKICFSIAVESNFLLSFPLFLFPPFHPFFPFFLPPFLPAPSFSSSSGLVAYSFTANTFFVSSHEYRHLVQFEEAGDWAVASHTLKMREIQELSLIFLLF